MPNCEASKLLTTMKLKAYHDATSRTAWRSHYLLSNINTNHNINNANTNTNVTKQALSTSRSKLIIPNTPTYHLSKGNTALLSHADPIHSPYIHVPFTLSPSPHGHHQQQHNFSSSSKRERSPVQVYERRLEKKLLRKDPRQIGAIKQLDSLYQCIKSNPDVLEPKNRSTSIHDFKQSSSSSSSFFSSWFGGGKKQQQSSTTQHVKPVDEDEIAPARDMKCHGLYLHGGVGCGKTMMMDMFYDCVHSQYKLRRHFHAFMLDIHKRLHELRSKHGHVADPIPLVANEITNEYMLICLDEFQVTDVADAMVLRRLFSNIFRNGAILVATSNRAPRDLYANGINRDAFLPFIDVLEAYCHIHPMEEGSDHRMLGTISHGIYHTPINSDTEKEINKIFEQMTDRSDDDQKPQSTEVEISGQGRKLKVPLASKYVAKFHFTDLCDKNLGAADYIALAEKFPYMIITDIPVLDSAERNRIRRFITLLDVFYENQVRVIFSAEKPVDQLFVGEHQSGDEQFASGRAISRLNEMQAKEYFAHASRKRRNDGPDLNDIFETK